MQMPSANHIVLNQSLKQCFNANQDNFNLDEFDNFDYQPTKKFATKVKAVSSESKNAYDFLAKLKESNQTSTNKLDIKKFKHMIYNTNKDVQSLTKDEFISQIETKFNHVSKAFSQLKQVDDRVEHPDTYEDLATNDLIMYIQIEEVGNYLFRGELESRELLMNSSESGAYRYVYDKEGDRWLCKKDNHLLDEILLRELMGKTKGYLSI